MKEIVSPQNPTFLKLLRLQKAQEIKKSGLTFFSGSKQVQEILRDYPERCEALVLDQSHALPKDYHSDTMHIFRLPPRLFKKIDLYGTGQPILIIRIDALPDWFYREKQSGCTLFIPFQDPINVGAMIRTAVAFGVSALVMLEEAAHPFHHKALRVAGSTVFRIPLFKGPSIRGLKEIPFPIFTLSPEGESIHGFRFPPVFGLVPGIEGPGIPPELYTFKTLGIPMQNNVESLNAATATGIILFSWQAQRSAGVK